MGKCIIFCAAEFDRLAEPIREKDFILAADGGLNHLKRLGISPNEILGDFDSLGYAPIGAKDQTADTEAVTDTALGENIKKQIDCQQRGQKENTDFAVAQYNLPAWMGITQQIDAGENGQEEFQVGIKVFQDKREGLIGET